MKADDMASGDIENEQAQEVKGLLTQANLLRTRRQFVEAEDVCRKALDIAPEDPNVHEMLGDILHECGKLDLALSEYRSALETAADKPLIETKYAKVAIEIGDREHEKAMIQDMLENPHKYSGRRRSPGLAALWSAIVPGLGQLYNGEPLKAAVVFGTFLLFIIAYALFQQPYPPHVRNMQMFLMFTNPLVLVLGVLSFIAYTYGLIDAPISAYKSSRTAKDIVVRKQIEV